MDSSAVPIPEKLQSAAPLSAPAYSRETILGMGQEELVELQTKLQEGDSEVQEQYRVQIADGTFAELQSLSEQMNASSSAPEELAKLREEADNFSRKLMDDLTSSSHTPEELTDVLAGYRLEKEQAGNRAQVLDEFSTDKVDVLKKHVLDPSGPLAFLGTAGVISFTASEMATLQSAQTEEEFNGSLRKYTKLKTEKYFGTSTELDSDDLMLLATEVQTQHEKAQKEQPTLMDKMPYAERIKEAASAAKNLIYFNVVRKASDDLHVSKGVLFRVGTKTFGELQQLLSAFDLNDINLDPKISEMVKLRDEIDDRRDELEDALRSAIQNFHQDGFTEEARERMLANVTVENMSIVSILSYWYMDHNERENWFTHCVSRISTMKRAYKHWGKRRDLTVARLGGLFEPKSFKQWQNAAAGKDFVENFDKGGKMKVAVLDDELKTLSGEIKGLSAEIETSIKDNTTKALRTTNAPHGEGLIQRRDAAVQKYNALGEKYSVKFGEMGTAMILEGQKLDAEGARLTPKTPAFADFEKRKAVYHKKFAVFAETKGLYDARFGEMAGHINKNLERLGQFEKGTAKAFAGRGHQDRVARDLAYLKNSNRLGAQTFRTAKMVALPGLVIGSEVYAALRGEAKWGEVGMDLTEAGAGFVPIVGTALDFKAAFSGKSLSGRSLSSGECWASFGFGMIGLVADVGTLLGGVGYGLRAGVAASRGARVAKNVANAGRFNSLVFRAGHAAGGAASFFRKSGRVKALEGVEETLSVTRTANRMDELRRLKKAGNLTDAAGITELARLEQMVSPEVLQHLNHNRFYRKGADLWLSFKGKIYKRTLPQSSVDAVEKTQESLNVAQEGVATLRAQVKELAGLGAFKEADVLAKLKSLNRSSSEYGDLQKAFASLKRAESVRDGFRWSARAKEAQMVVEQERMVRQLGTIDTFVGHASKVGMGSAALLMLTAGHVGPVDVVEGAYDAAKPVAHVAGKVTDELFFEDHAVNDSVEGFVEDESSNYVTSESSVEEQLAGAIEQGERKEYIEHQARKGVPVDQVLRDHADDEGFRQIAYEAGKSEVLAESVTSES